MRVAVVSDLIRANGAGVMALLAADLLTDSGHDVVVLGGAMQADLVARLRHAHSGGAAAFTNDERALDIRISPSDHRAFIAAFNIWFAAELQSFAPDVVYVHNCGRVLGQLDLCELSNRIPVVHTMHDEWFISDAHYTFRPRTGANTALTRTFEPHRASALLNHGYDHIFDVPDRAGELTLVAPSQWLTDRAREVFPTLRVEHLPNAVDESLFALQDPAQARALLGIDTQRPIVLFVGSPTQARKGYALFEAAADAADAQLDDALIRIVAGGPVSAAIGDVLSAIGHGPIADRLAVPMSAASGRLEMGNDTTLISGLDRSLMPALYGAADLLVHPSIIDNLPTVPIEAGMCGTRCLASDVGGTAETIADAADLFDTDIESAALAERMLHALAEERDHTPAQRAARRTAQTERFSLGGHRVRLLALLERVTSASTAEVTG